MEIINILDLNLLFKLGISALLGLVIGLERELKSKPLGLKTSLVISIISCLLTIVSIEAAYFFPGNDEIGIQMDPLRLAAQIVSGVGFLGAGVILRRENERISGLTTAAMIWGAAGIGIAVGAGFYIEASAGVVLILISVELIPFILSKLGPKKLMNKDIIIKIVIENRENLDEIIEMLNEEKISVTRTRIKIDVNVSTCTLDLKTRAKQNQSLDDIYRSIFSIVDAKTVEVIGF